MPGNPERGRIVVLPEAKKAVIERNTASPALRARVAELNDQLQGLSPAEQAKILFKPHI